MSQHFDSYDAVQDEHDSLQGELDAMTDKATDAAIALQDRIDDLAAFLDCDIEHDIAVIDAALEMHHGDIAAAQTSLQDGYGQFDSVAAYAESLVDAGIFEVPSIVRPYVDFEKMGNDMLHDFTWSEVSGGIIVWNN